MFLKVACNSLVVYVGKAVPVDVYARKKAYATLEHAALAKKRYSGNRRKADRTALCQTFYKFEIKIMSSYMSNEAWFQTSILYEISSLYRVMKSFCIHVFCIYIYATYMYIIM